ncbi:Gfo/Idh/MocA family protein [Paenarthrobacter sp. AMU7]|uniref:Gfo/Idh/MocA family protein n=1 Tax=Paenarthrobacter sp. AMU7 TaxID=3162492 RepID=A0AB39YRW4_9MICC
MDAASPSSKQIDPWRIAVVGFDHMHAGDQISVIKDHPRALLVGAWDSNPDRMQQVCAELEVPPHLQYGDLDALIAETAPQIAVVCSTTADHRRYVDYFVERGIHVLLEKPLASTVNDARAIVGAAASAPGVLVGVNWPLAWYPVHRTARRLISEGVIGSVLEVHYYDGNRGPLFHTHGKHEVDDAEVANAKASTWWYSAAEGGGSLRDYLGYGATLATWFRDGELPTDVTARTHISPGDEVDEQSVVIASYRSGLSTFQTRWGTFTDPWTHQPYPRCGFVIVGSAGTIASFDYAEAVQVQDNAHPEGQAIPVDELAPGDTGGVPNLIHALDHGLPLEGPVSLEVSMAGHLIVEAAAQSAADQTPVRLDTL